MKVAVLIDTWFPFIGGGQINALEISKRIAAKGIQVDIITRNCGKENITYPNNLKIFKLGTESKPSSQVSKIIYCFKAFTFLVKNRYDLVSAHAFLPGITAKFITVFKSTPGILTVHGTSIGTNLNNRASLWIEKCILTKTLYSAQITVSQDFFKIKNVNKNIFYISNGIDLKEFDKVKFQKSKNPRLIFIGRFHKQKNIPNLIKAVKIARNKISNLELILVGDGQEKENITRLIQKLNLSKSITLIGPKRHHDLVKLLKSSTAFVLPSIYEGQPLSLLEAWGAKLPPVVSNTGDCRYLVQNGKNGYLIDNPQDAHEIANVIVKALSDKNLAKRGQIGYNFVKRNFSWEKSAAATLDVYKSLTKSQN